MKKKLVSTMLAMTLICSMAACGGSPKSINDSGTQESEKQKTDDAPSGKSDSEGITIRLMAMNTREEAETNGYQYAFWKAVDEWKEAHPEVTVEEKQWIKLLIRQKLMQLLHLVICLIFLH